jgi:ferrochelatase
VTERSAILLLAHGTPDRLDEIPEYLLKVTRGRPLPKSVVEEIEHHYSLIATETAVSPLTKLTRQQGELLSERLGLPVYIGMRNWKPLIVDTVRAMRSDGITQCSAICLAPQNSRTSVGLYRSVLLAETDEMRVDFLEGWADHPLLADAFAERLRAVWTRGTPVLFTAHSVPARTLQSEEGENADPYADEAKRTAAMVAERVGLRLDEWRFAFQSQGASGGPWIGPTVEETLTALHQEGVKCVVLQPVGFLCDHVEILYDIDIAFRTFAASLGVELVRPESLNDSPLLTEALADLALQGLARLG